MTSVSADLADMMLEEGTFVVRPENPVRWASGHLMPVYNDNRRLLSHPRARRLVVRGFAEILDRRRLSVTGVVGIATGGIAPAVSLADGLGLRLYYVRPGAKDHGLGLKIEGADDAENREPVVLIEDLVSTGGSSVGAARTVHEAGFPLELCLAVFSYRFEEAEQRFAALPFRCAMEPLVTIDLLMERATKQNRTSSEHIETVRKWVASPFEWSAR